MPPNASGSPDLPNLTFGVLVRSRWRQLHEPVDHLEEPRTLFVAQLVFFRGIAGDRLADDHALRLPEPLRRLAQRRDGLLVERERQLCHTAILPYSNTAGGARLSVRERCSSRAGYGDSSRAGRSARGTARGRRDIRAAPGARRFRAPGTARARSRGPRPAPTAGTVVPRARVRWRRRARPRAAGADAAAAAPPPREAPRRSPRPGLCDTRGCDPR